MAATLAKAVAAACFTALAFRISTPIAPIEAGSGSLEACRNPTMPFYILGKDVQEKSQHDFDAIFGNPGEGITPNPQWMVLNYGTKDGQNRRWYALAPFRLYFAHRCKGKTGGETGKDCDEFPYFTTEQGGRFATPTPSLRAINAEQNQLEGSLRYNRLERRCNLEQEVPGSELSNGSGGDRYLVLPMAGAAIPNLMVGGVLSSVPTTFGLCNRGGGGDS